MRPALGRGVEIGGEPAAVDGDAERTAIGKVADQIAPPQLDRVDAEPARRQLDQPLGQVVGLGFAGAAIGVDRHGVGEDAAHAHEHRRDGIDAAHRGRRRVGRAARAVGRHVSAEIGHRLDIERKEPAVGVERQPPLGPVVAALRRGEKILAALADPFDRAAEPPRRPQHQHPFGIEEILHPEPAADIGRADADALGRHVEDRIGELVAQAVHALARQHQIEAVARLVIAADRGTRLDRHDDQPVVDELDLDDMRGARHRGGDRRLVAALVTVGEVAGRLVPQQRRVVQQRRRRIGHRRQHAVIDRHKLGGVAGKLAGLGDDKSDRIADMTHSPGGERETRRDDHRLHRRDLGDAGQRADIVGGKIGGGEDAANTGQRPRRFRVDAGDLRVAVRRAQHDRMQLPRCVDVLDKAPLAAQEAHILEAAHRAPDLPVRCRHPSI